MSSTENGQLGKLFLIAVLCAFLDQATKFIIVRTIPLYEGFEIIPGLFNIVYIQNHGAAFGLLNNPDTTWQFWFFAIITVFVVVFIINLARTSPYNRWLNLGFGLILGGAVGNFIDRVRLRYVIDFLDFYIGSWHWPVFNVADIGICIGTAFVAWQYYSEAKHGTTSGSEQG